MKVPAVEDQRNAAIVVIERTVGNAAAGPEILHPARGVGKHQVARALVVEAVAEAAHPIPPVRALTVGGEEAGNSGDLHGGLGGRGANLAAVRAGAGADAQVKKWIDVTIDRNRAEAVDERSFHGPRELSPEIAARGVSGAGWAGPP